MLSDSQPIAIMGNRVTVQRSAIAAPFRIFNVATGANVTLTGLTITGGNANNGDGTNYSATNSLVETNQCGTSSPDPLLGNNFVPQLGSPAFDQGSPATCLPTDINGTARPLNGDGAEGAVCDIGAVEAPDAPTQRVTVTATDAVGSETAPDTITFTFRRAIISSAPLTVSYTIGGTAETIDITVIGDAIAEPNFTLVLTITNMTAGLSGTASSEGAPATISVTDDDTITTETPLPTETPTGTVTPTAAASTIRSFWHVSGCGWKPISWASTSTRRGLAGRCQQRSSGHNTDPSTEVMGHSSPQCGRFGCKFIRGSAAVVSCCAAPCASAYRCGLAELEPVSISSTNRCGLKLDLHLWRLAGYSAFRNAFCFVRTRTGFLRLLCLIREILQIGKRNIQLGRRLHLFRISDREV